MNNKNKKKIFNATTLEFLKAPNIYNVTAYFTLKSLSKLYMI